MSSLMHPAISMFPRSALPPKVQLSEETRLFLLSLLQDMTLAVSGEHFKEVALATIKALDELGAIADG